MVRIKQPPMNETIIKLPTSAVCRICAYSMSDRCEPCLDNKLAEFDPKSNLTFFDLPLFPDEEFRNGMPLTVKTALIAFYIRKLQEALR